MIVYYIIYMLVPCSFLATEFHFTFDATAIVGLHEFALSERISGHFLGQSTEKNTNIWHRKNSSQFTQDLPNDDLNLDNSLQDRTTLTCHLCFLGCATIVFANILY